MVAGKGFEILLASPPDYDELVAEIYYDGRFAALIRQEAGKGKPCWNLPELVSWKVIRKVELSGLLKDDASPQK